MINSRARKNDVHARTAEEKTWLSVPKGIEEGIGILGYKLIQTLHINMRINVYGCSDSLEE